MKKEYLKIIIPEEFSEIPIQIIRRQGNRKVIFDMKPDGQAEYADTTRPKYAFIWKGSEYMKVSFDEIKWITAEGSYSLIHLTGERELMVSFHLSMIEENLPPDEFIRIHRSHIVNLGQVDSMIGNLLKIGDVSLPIGREYKENVLGRFVFLGIRRKKKQPAVGLGQ